MEGYGPSSYGDAFADVYDDWYGGLAATDAIVERLEALAPGAPLLELGAGTGRLALPLATAGRRVVAVDASQRMLERLRAKPEGARVEVVCADMARLPIGPGGFGLVLVAFNTFFNLTSDGDQRRCLAEARRLLAPAGLLVLESIVFPDTNQPVQGVDASIVELGRVVLTASRLDPAERSVIGQHIELTDGNVRLRPWVLRYALPSELDGMAERAGFRLESRWEDWAGTPFTDASTRQVVVYRRA